ncbi:ATP-binding protein [Anaerovibrio lipolyticus]|uniref:ATP-binding protein n=1 Tax=Anaerovibrio lipolyticus TaxID=82374 RepID=UPI0025E12A35|nr:ATP-binding protein [Anaerovibrio lipolyticus]
MIYRGSYLKELLYWRDKQVIKVITGIRRCGKSTMFSLFIDELLKDGVEKEQIIRINLEDMAYEELLEYHKLYSYVKERLQSGKKTYIFLDEIQNCQEYERAVDSLFIQPDTDIYITGSNAFMLSGELATLLSGRYVTISMQPLSFTEFYSVCENMAKEQAFQEYMKNGGFPYITRLNGNEESVRQYLEGIYNTILVKDVANREKISDLTILESIVRTLASNIGSPISTKKIADTLISNGRKISINTVDRYVRALVDSYIFYKVDRYDVKGRQYLKTFGKYYIADTGLRRLLTAESTSDMGHLLENIVYLELKRRYMRVSIGKVAEYETDFVVENAGESAYYQVSASVLDEGTKERELRPLQKIKDNHPKVLLTLDVIGKNANYDGIRQYNLIDWLLEEKIEH